jgi:hypothetical protein
LKESGDEIFLNNSKYYNISKAQAPSSRRGRAYCYREGLDGLFTAPTSTPPDQLPVEQLRVKALSRPISLKRVLEKVDEMASLNVRVASELESELGDLRAYYCPSCLRVRFARAEEGGATACSRCNELMRPLDEEYARERARLTSEWREKAKALLERVWDSLRDWRPWKGVEVKAYVNGLKVVFDDPSYLWIGVEGREVEARLHLYYFTEAYAPRLKSILEAIRGVKLKCLVYIDGKPDRCRASERTMRELGFKLEGPALKWVMEIGP